jgi:voltage-gated potassium channel
MVMKNRSLKKRRQNYIREILASTPIVKMVGLLLGLWLLFSAGIYWGEYGAVDTKITSYGRALYWGVAAFSTAGIADTPVNGLSTVLGAIWIVIGSTLFFGVIVATVTAYFMRPLQRPSKHIIDTIEYNLEQLDDLSVAELELLKDMTDSLIEHVENLKRQQEQHLELRKKDD